MGLLIVIELRIANPMALSAATSLQPLLCSLIRSRRATAGCINSRQSGMHENKILTVYYIVVNILFGLTSKDNLTTVAEEGKDNESVI